jgi:putative transposase
MANIREVFIPDSYYHVFNHAIEESNLFNEERNYYYFLEKYEKYISPIAETLAYCLMPNHYHFLVKLKSKDDLVGFFNPEKENLDIDINKKIANQFGTLQNSYAKAFNNSYGRKGSLFLHSVERRRINGEYYLSNAIVYIHMNPVKHGFVDKPEDWKFSSYHAYLEEKQTKIRKDHGLNYFTNKSSFKEMHKKSIDPNFIIDMDYEY